MALALLSPRISAFCRDESACSTSFAPQFSRRLQCSVLSHEFRGRGAMAVPVADIRHSRSGLSFITTWQGRAHLGDFMKVFAGFHQSSSLGSMRRVSASLLGVGAPEALVIAIVALVVFGPKGLAEVARTLGKSLKAFQPTIRELQQVSREFRSTLEEEMGLDELRNPKPMDDPLIYQRSPPKQNGAPDRRSYSAEDYPKVTEEQAKSLVPEELRREAEAAAWGSSPPLSTPAKNGIKESVTEENVAKDSS